MDFPCHPARQRIVIQFERAVLFGQRQFMGFTITWQKYRRATVINSD